MGPSPTDAQLRISPEHFDGALRAHAQAFHADVQELPGAGHAFVKAFEKMATLAVSREPMRVRRFPLRSAKCTLAGRRKTLSL